MTSTIQSLKAGHREAWEALWRAYLDFYETSLHQKQIELTWKRLLDEEREDMHGFIALDDGEPLGIVHFLTHAHFWREEQVVYLQDLFVAPEARGKRVGEALIQAVYEAADANDTPKVYWLTARDNEPGRKLYDRIATLSPFIRYDR